MSFRQNADTRFYGKMILWRFRFEEPMMPLFDVDILFDFVSAAEMLKLVFACWEEKSDSDPQCWGLILTVSFSLNLSFSRPWLDFFQARRWRKSTLFLVFYHQTEKWACFLFLSKNNRSLSDVYSRDFTAFHLAYSLSQPWPTMDPQVLLIF